MITLYNLAGAKCASSLLCLV